MRDDPLHTEGLAGDASDEDVRVVAVGHRLGLVDPGLEQPVTIESDAGDRTAGEVLSSRRKPPPPIDDRHRVTEAVSPAATSPLVHIRR